LKEPLPFTIETLGEVERSLDYQTYMEHVEQALEAEKKDLGGLSDDEILKDANSKIKDYLDKQFRIKLDEETDPQNWEQVQKTIQIRASGPYKKLLENPDKLSEIKSYIQKLKGRENYINYILRSVLANKFGISNAPFNPQDWEAVRQVIENMRFQEYVDTEIREKGILPRKRIIAMLFDMQVLTAE
jgi:hypothetical protein